MGRQIVNFVDSQNEWHCVAAGTLCEKNIMLGHKDKFPFQGQRLVRECIHAPERSLRRVSKYCRFLHSSSPRI